MVVKVALYPPMGLLTGIFAGFCVCQRRLRLQHINHMLHRLEFQG